MAAAARASCVALYLRNPLLFETSAKVTAKETSTIKGKEYYVIELDQTIFHPQGGGQPSDRGTINGISVVHVNKVVGEAINDFSIQHCFTEEPSFKIGDVVTLKVEEEPRRLHMRLHSAGHLIADVVGRLFNNLVAKSGNHNPGDCYVKFDCKDGQFPDKDAVISQGNAELEKMITSKTPAKIIEEEGTRKMQIGDAPAVPCGGTHVTNMEDLGQVVITGAKPNAKEKVLTVKYEVKDI